MLNPGIRIVSVSVMIRASCGMSQVISRAAPYQTRPLQKHAHAVYSHCFIMETCPCNKQRFLAFKIENFQLKIFDIFLIFAQNIDRGYTLEPPRQGGSNEYPQSMFWRKK